MTVIGRLLNGRPLYLCERTDCTFHDTDPGHATLDCYCWRADERTEAWRRAERADVESESGDLIVAAAILNAP